MSQRTQVLLFIGLVVALVGARALEHGSLAVAIGGSIGEIPLSIILGRVLIWFSDKLLLFARNMANPDSPKSEFQRTIWLTLSLSLALGFPFWLLLGSLG
jgi:hypothetical protein